VKIALGDSWNNVPDDTRVPWQIFRVNAVFMSVMGSRLPKFRARTKKMVISGD
jgi:hypothetical protein